ncbi:Peptidase S24-like protein [compost metagenome]
MSLNADHLRVIYNQGDSNWPTLSDGEVLLVDVSRLEPSNGKMFAMYDPDDEVIIKRLIRDMSGGWVIR